LISCIDKQYKYVEIVNEVGVFGSTSRKENEAENKSAPNDSAAYLEAYLKFCISKKVHKDMGEALNQTFTTPLEFKLLNDKGEDITYSVSFPTKQNEEKRIEDQIFSQKNSIKESLEKNKMKEAEELKKSNKVDSLKVKRTEKNTFWSNLMNSRIII
jgi:hypothetical protein